MSGGGQHKFQVTHYSILEPWRCQLDRCLLRRKLINCLFGLTIHTNYLIVALMMHNCEVHLTSALSSRIRDRFRSSIPNLTCCLMTASLAKARNPPCHSLLDIGSPTAMPSGSKCATRWPRDYIQRKTKSS